jgi:hypothetical protein
VRFNNVRAAIKLQFRDVDSFIHKDFRDRSDIYYIRRVTETKMSKEDYETLGQRHSQIRLHSHGHAV